MTVLRVDTIAASGQTSENTGSVYFDGTGDYIFHGGSDIIWNTNASDACTFECWLYVTDLSSARQIFHLGDEGDFSIQTDGQIRVHVLSSNFKDTNQSITTNTWYHIALVQETGRKDVYINGVKSTYTIGSGDPDGSNWDTQAATNGNYFYIGDDGVYRDYFQGYISNLRVVRNIALYNENFTPPTRELEVTPETVLVCCHDGENIFAEKTGKIIAAYGDRLSSPTPTATDSPIGITTNYPPVTRGVDVTAGPTLDGDLEFNSQNFFVLPKGTTTERMPSFGGDQSGTRGFFAGGYNPTRTNVINYVNVPTLGNAIDFGNLGAANGGPTGFSDSTRGWIAGGNIAPTITNVMEYVTMASSGNAVDGGDLITATGARPGSVANSIRGIIAGGSTPGQVRTIVHHTIQTTGIVQDFGDLTEVKSGVAGVMSPTRGVFAGGRQPGAIDTIEYVTIASTGNAVLFGELSLDDRGNMGGASNTVRGLFGGGRSPTDHAHIEYITIATLGDAQDFGDLTQSGMDGDVGAVSNSTRVVFGGGSSDELGYVEIASLGNSIDFGKFTVNTTANQDPACFSNGHGGLG